jgi:cytochrome c biogenesis protein CcdA
VLQLPSDPLPTYGAFGAVGIGMLHGIGAETPTQVVIFAGAAGVAGVWSGLLVLSAFVVGLVVANTIVAAAAAFGFVGSSRRRWAYLGLSVVTAVCSLVIGTLFLLQRGDMLPVIFSG